MSNDVGAGRDHAGDGAAAPLDPATTTTAAAAGGGGHLLGGLRRQALTGEAAGAREAKELGSAAEALHLAITATGLQGEHVLVGHLVGLHVVLPAGGLHGPRQTPAIVYLFGDALAVRPSDAAPMSTIPMLGLHMVFPPLAVTRWLYKAGRIEHANLDLVEVAGTFEAALPNWTVDDFAGMDPKVDVHRTDALGGPVHVYEHLGFAHLQVPVPDHAPLHLQSTLPTTAESFAKLWELCGSVAWPQGLTMAVPQYELRSGS